MEFALTHPAGLASLILASSPASIPQWIAEANRLRKELPQEVEQTLRHHEEAGTTDEVAYEEAMMVFYRRHVCRLDPWPEPLTRTFAKLEANPEVYNTMFGPSEFHATGTLKEWDVRDRLGEIRLPTLVTSGRHDEATPTIAETVHRGFGVGRLRAEFARGSPGGGRVLAGGRGLHASRRGGTGPGVLSKYRT